MKKSWIKRKGGLHRIGTTERQREIANTWRAFAKMVRERDAAKGCITCSSQVSEAGHFRRSDCEITQFHPYNVNGQCGRCNRYEGGKTFEYGLALDKKYGRGWANFLYKLSQKTKGFDVKELGLLKDAARRGSQIYEITYFDIRPEQKLMTDMV